MATYNKMTETKFKAIKIILQGGATVAEAAEYMQVSEFTVYAVRNAETWVDYTNYVAAKALAAKQAAARKKATTETAAATVDTAPAAQLAKPEQVVEHKQTVVVQATWQMTQEMQKTNELLKLISNKLAYIVEQLS